MKQNKSAGASRRSGGDSSAVARVLAEIAAGRFRTLYFFLNSDEVFVDEVVAQLKRQLLVPGLEVFDFEAINAAEIRGERLSVPVVLQRIRQAPVAARRRLVVLRHLEEMHGGLLDELLPGLLTVPDSTSVVATLTGERKLVERCREAGLDEFIIDEPAPTGEALKRLVVVWVQNAGLEIEPAAVDELIDIAGEDIMFLKNEIEKMVTALESGAKVTPAIVREYASANRVFEMNDFITAVVNRRRSEALRILRQLEETGESAVRIVVNLGYAFMAMLKVKMGQKPVWSIKPERRGGLRYWNTERIDVVLKKLYEINLKIVSGYMEPFALIEMLTAAIAPVGSAGQRKEGGWR